MEVTDRIKSLWNRLKGTPWLDEAVLRMDEAVLEMREAMSVKRTKSIQKEASNGRTDNPKSHFGH